MKRNLTWKRVSLTLAIVVVLNLFFNVGVRTFYPGPKHEDYCPASIFEKSYDTRDACVAAGGAWRAEPVRVVDEKRITGYCDAGAACQKEYEEVQSVYNRNVFIVLLVAGTLSLVIGMFLQSSLSVANGLLYGGVLSYVIATIRFWSNMDDYVRFVILGIVLAFLIALGIKKLRDE
jgi:hypothetical protein